MAGIKGVYAENAEVKREVAKEYSKGSDTAPQDIQASNFA
jgi:hypothetical protein